MGGFRRALEPLALTLLRISIGVIMAVHGWDKIQNLGFGGWADILAQKGFPAPMLMSYLSIGGEFLGGIGLIVGFLTPLAALGIVGTMAGAIFSSHWPEEFIWYDSLLAKNNGFEYPMTIFFVALYFVMRGAGPISIDALFCRKSTTETGES